MNPSIAGIRKDYAAQTLLESEAEANPVEQFRKWWGEALASRILEPNAMTLATASADGLPSARIVLLKDFSDEGFVFYTNYESCKAVQLRENPKACLVFHWKELERQVRLVGLVHKVAAAESDAYYRSRPAGSRIGAWASPQSRVIKNRQWLDEEYKSREEEFSSGDIPRPANWGGYTVKPVVIEFWQGRASRLHDRLQYTLEGGKWKRDRLAP